MARYFEQSVRVDLFHSLTRTLTLLLTSRYVWIDWSSMPQPSACPPSTDKKVKEKLGTNLGKAVKSIPAYVNHVSFHTPLDSHESITREQIRRKIRLCRDCGPWLSSRRSKRSGNEPQNEDMLQNVQKSRVVCPRDGVFSAQSRENTSCTSNHIR